MEDNDNTDERQRYVAETGEGSLLQHTVGLVETHLKPSLAIVDLGNGETGVVALGNSGGETKLDILDPSEFDDYRAKPLFLSGTPSLGSLSSLIDYTNRYKTDETVLFANDDRNCPSISSVLDYHIAGPGGQRAGRHVAVHNLPLSDEWEAWASLDGESITMPNFARFLEDHIVDVMPPGMIELSPEQENFVQALGGKSRIADPAKLMELATGLRVFEDSQVSQATNLQTGEGELVMTNTHTDGQGGKLIIPSMFVIAIPVFQHGERYQIIVRLRYRRAQGIVFIYELWRDDLVFDHAFNEAADRAKEETGVPLFRGRS